MQLLLLRSGDIEKSLGLKKSSVFKFCQWNLNSVAALDFVEIPLIDTFITTHKFDIMCLSLTFLDSAIPHYDENININDYSLLRCSSDKGNKAGSELGNITTSAGYSHLICIPIHFINESSSCVLLIFCSNAVLHQIVELNHQFKKNVIVILSTELYILTYLCHLHITERFRITNVLIPKILKKKLFPCLIGRSLSKSKQ